MTNFELIAEAIELMNAGNIEAATTRLKQFTVLNTPKVKNGGKVNIWKWISDDQYRPQYCGVYYDTERKVAVATDTHVLLVSKPDYIEREKSEIISKNGDVIKGRYPEYWRVIPRQERLTERAVNRDRLAELLTEVRADKKINKNVDYIALNMCDADSPFYVPLEYVRMLLTLPAGRFYFPNVGEFAPMLYKSDDGNYTAIAMPMHVNPDYIGQEKIAREQSE